MKTYDVKTEWSDHTVLATSFEEAYGLAQKILAKEHAECKKEKLEKDAYPDIKYIEVGDEIDEVK